MLSERNLVELIHFAALKGTDADIDARRNAIWIACQTLMADCLRGADEFTRERLLLGLERELRASVDHLSQLLAPSSPYPRCPAEP